MQYTDERHHLRVNIEAKEYRLEPDELTQIEKGLASLGEAVGELPMSDLTLTILHHEHTNAFHVEARLAVPGKKFKAGAWDADLQAAFERCLRQLVSQVENYKKNPDNRAEEVAEHLVEIERDIVAPEDPDQGVLGAAVTGGDYLAFRTALAPAYEEWLRRRAGRWVQRYPEAEARIVRKRLAVDDIVEDVFLNAFEGYAQRPITIAFHAWLDSLIDPSLKALLRHPDDEKENVSFAQTLTELSLEDR